MDVGAASKAFDRFLAESDFEPILFAFFDVMQCLDLKFSNCACFFPKLKSNIMSHSGQSFLSTLEEKRRHPIYENNTATHMLNVLVVGGGPCGLRTAIEAQLLGSRVIVLEKRTSFTRNNVLHIWPFVIDDLKRLGAKCIYPKFCIGSMNHISIRRLQAVLLKIALVLGVEVHRNVGFVGLKEPTFDNEGWQVRTEPEHYLNNLKIDVLVGAQGKRITVPGFGRKEFRGKLAIAITANFTNKNTSAEATVEEISGVAYVYKQDFFNALYDDLGIALENIVYYKDETHYFVMTTKKHSLLDRNVLIEDHKDPEQLLRPDNIRQSELLNYIRDTCDYCTDYKLPNLSFALNHHGQPDVALFDFTSMYAAKNAVYALQRANNTLLLLLVGDSLLEPFWPTGTGAARGFLGSLDACWAMYKWASQESSVLDVIAEREAIYKLLPQITPEMVAKEHKRFTIDPATRYPNLKTCFYGFSPTRASQLFDCPESEKLEASKQAPRLRAFIGYSQTLNYPRNERHKMNASTEAIMEAAEPLLLRQEEPKAQTEMRARAITLRKDDSILTKNNPRPETKRPVSPIRQRSLGSNPRRLSEELKKPVEKAFWQTRSMQDSQQRQGAGRMATGPSRTPRLASGESVVSDCELDQLLASLERDEEFVNLDENAKLSWLESLFFLDTKNPVRDSHNLRRAPPPRRPQGDQGQVQQQHEAVRRARDGRLEKSRTMPMARVGSRDLPASPQTERRAPPSPSMSRSKSTLEGSSSKSSENGAHGHVNVNPNMISVAQSFFKKSPTPSPRSPMPSRRPNSMAIPERASFESGQDQSQNKVQLMRMLQRGSDILSS